MANVFIFHIGGTHSTQRTLVIALLLHHGMGLS